MVSDTTAPGVFVRRAEFDDHPAILALIGDEAHVLSRRFGAYDVTRMIENATLGITAVDGEGHVLGYAAFFDAPALTPALDPTAWPEWLEDVFGHPEFSAQNTLWLSFFVADHLYEGEVCDNILRTAFTTLPEMDVFLLALPPDQKLFAPLRQSFESVPPLDGQPPQPCALHACPRGLYIPNLRVRQARVEDHDDLLPVFNQQSELLSARYGEFFVADVIGAQDERSQALVAEADGHAVGLMALTSDIDVRMLADYFELEAYDALLKPPPPRRRRPSRSGGPAAAAAAEAEAADAAEAAEADERSASPEPAPSPDDDDDDAPVDRRGWSCNAFCVTLFCIDESFESRALDLLRPAFALFPDLEYCVVTLPHVTAEFALLASFTLAQPRPHEAGAGAGASPGFGHVLYLFHRAALAGQLAVREARAHDLPGARALTDGLLEQRDLLDAMGASVAALDGGGARPAVVSFVVECQAQVVGVCTLAERGVDVGALKSAFALEDYVLFSEHDASTGHARLISFVLNPIFHKHARFVLKELFRKARKSVLYLALPHGQAVPEVAAQFVQVRPRRQIERPTRAPFDGNGRDGDGDRDGALLFLTRKLISEPKLVSNVRVVVAGASDTSIGFLEALLTMPHLHFTHVTLIAKDGLTDIKADDAARAGGAAEPAVAPDAFESSSLSYSRRELRQLGLSSRVKVIRAHVADVERVSKTVELAGSSERVPYDVLLLAPPLHDQTLAALPEGARTVAGAFSVSGGQVALAIDDYLRSSAWQRRLGAGAGACDCFVYGGTLSAYASLQALLARGVRAEQLTLLVPPAASAPFADPRVEARVAATLSALGIGVVRGSALRDVRAAADGAIGALTLADEGGGEYEVAAALLLTADVPDVDEAIFRACNSNSLVYDGRLVIDARFKTSDASIYAAGPLTKFSRRYRGGFNLESYDKREVGIKVANSLLPLLDPLSAQAPQAQPDALPTFAQPRSEAAVLPGGLLYLHVQRPAKPLPYAELLSSGHIARELQTLTDDTDYCCFRIDSHDTLDAITYLGASTIEVGNLQQLIGLPQTYLNTCAARFDEGLVTDLPAFLREAWAMCLFHDRFADFRGALTAELLEEEAFAAIAADVKERLEASLPLPSRDDLRGAVATSTRQLCEKRLIEYLQTNQNHLGMYLVPSASVMRKMEDSDLIHGKRDAAPAR